MTDPVIFDPLIERTYIDLLCNMSIHNGVDTDVYVDFVWHKNGTTIINGSDYSISEVELVSSYYISTVRIEELKTSDNNAVFRCSVTTSPSESTFITESDGYDETIIKVRGLF